MSKALIWALMIVATPAWTSEDIGWTQNLGAKLPLQTLFTDENGNRIQLGESFHDKPVILTFAYYRCPNLCTLVLNGVTDALRKIREKPGVDFTLLTLSINPTDPPRLALMKKRTSLARISGHDGESDFAFWRFLTGKQAAIDGITRAAGFHYHYDSVASEYIHPSGMIVLSSDGVIRQYFTGIRFDPSDLSRALRRASRFRTGSVIDQILIFCFHYDPSSNRVGTRVLLALRVLGSISAIAVLAALARAFIAEVRT